MEDVPNLTNSCPTNPILQGLFRRFCMCPLHNAFDKNKKVDVDTGVPQQRQEVY